MAGLTPEQIEQAVNLAADRLSRRFFWTALTIVGAAWALATAAIIASSWRVAGAAVLMLVPAAASGLASLAFQSPRMRREQADQLKQKLKS